MTTNGEQIPGEEEPVFTNSLREELDAQNQEAIEAEMEQNIDILAHDNDSIEALDQKLGKLNQLEDEVRQAVDSLRIPETKREDVVNATKRLAKQLHIDSDYTSLGILADMPEVIQDYRNDILELLAKKREREA